jgi:hypothetical protein
MKVFKLIKKSEVDKASLDALLLKRLQTSIKLLLKENKFLPRHFNFRGRSLLDQVEASLLVARSPGEEE